MSAPLKWTAATRKKLHGFRLPHKADPPDVAPSLAEAWGSLQRFADLELHGDPQQIADAKKLSSEKTPPVALDPAGELLRARIATARLQARDCDKWEGWAVSRALVALWCEVGSPRAAVDLLLAPACFGGMGPVLAPHEPRIEKTCQGCGQRWEGSMDECCGAVVSSEVEEPSPWGSLWHVYQPLWWALRARLSVVPEETFAAARDSIEELFTDVLEPERHAWLTFAFNRDRDLARREIERARRRLDSDPPPPLQLPLLVSVPDAALGVELVTRYNVHSFGLLGFDLVEALGHEARPIFETAYEGILKHSAKQYHKPGLAAFKMIQ